MNLPNDNRNFYQKLNQTDPMNKVMSEYWSDDEIEAVWVEPMEENEELFFEHP